MSNDALVNASPCKGKHCIHHAKGSRRKVECCRCPAVAFTDREFEVKTHGYFRENWVERALPFEMLWKHGQKVCSGCFRTECEVDYRGHEQACQWSAMLAVNWSW